MFSMKAMVTHRVFDVKCIIRGIFRSLLLWLVIVSKIGAVPIGQDVLIAKSDRTNSASGGRFEFGYSFSFVLLEYQRPDY